MSRTFLNALGLLLFLGLLMAAVYAVGGVFEHAREVIQLR